MKKYLAIQNVGLFDRPHCHSVRSPRLRSAWLGKALLTIAASIAFVQVGLSQPMVTCPPRINVPCPPDVPPGATTLAGFLAQGGTVVSGGPVTVSFVDGPLTPGPTQGQITRTYTITDPTGSANCQQLITVVDHLECHFTGLAATNFIVPPLPVQLVDPACLWLVDNFPISHFVATLSNVPPGFCVTNGIYIGWCVDAFNPIRRDGTKYRPLLYSSTDPFLPPHLANTNWDLVNYILNHKQGSAFDIQFAIWNFIGGPTPTNNPDFAVYFPPTPAALALIADALANGEGFVPSPGELVAVILDVDRGMEPRVQLNIIEVECLPIDRRCEGEDVQYCVDCVGQGPVTYMWTKNGVAIPGLTGPCLTLSNLTIGDSGLYCVKVTGPCVTEISCLSLTVTNVADVEVPRLICPPTLVVPCYDLVPPPDTNAVIVIGDQSRVTVTFEGEVITTNGCRITIIRTYHATDVCGNVAVCTQTIIVIDDQPPTLTCGPDKEVECGTDWAFDIPTAVDICDGFNVVIEVVSTVTNVASPRCPKIFSVTRTWRATDKCTNSSFCNQTVTIVDTEPPNITCEEDTEVLCGTDWAFDIPTAVDKCDLNNVVIEVVSTVTNVITPRCPGLFSVRRTWRATDTCGNSSFCNQTVTIVDIEPPNITCEEDKEVQCGTDWAFDIPTAVDKCDLNNVVIEVVSTVTNVISPRCPGLFSVRRTWRATDTCGNASFCNQTVTIVDTEPPNITCEQDKEAECGTDWAFDRPTAVDKCDGTNVVIEITSTVTNVASPRCPQLFSVRRTWRATDTCGNASFCNQTVTIVDTEPPNITCEQDKEAECGTDWAFDRPTAVDKCDGTNVVIEITSTVTNVISPRCPGLFSVRRTWRATDTCGHSSFCNQTVTIVDTLPPALACAPDEIAQCGTPFGFTRPTAVDLCDGTNVVIEITSTVTNAGMCPVKFSVTRTWRATDTCGNSSFCNQIITVVDTTPPVAQCAPNRVIECGFPVPQDTPTFFDLCDGTNLTMFAISGIAPLCGNTFQISRSWTAIDSCSNATTCSQTVLVVDTLPPVLTCAPDRIVECGTPWNFTRPYANDLCDGTNVTVRIISTVTNATCGRTFSATRTWEAIDSCTNRSVCSQTIVVVDTTPPHLTCAPDRFVECGFPWNFSPPSAVDICDGTNVTVQIVSTETNLLCGMTFVATRTWRATDQCGNNTICSQTIYVVDTLPPQLFCQPNRVVECGVPWAFGQPVAYDICDPQVDIRVVETTTNRLCGDTFSATRIWSATDDCGNVSFCVQTFVVVDTLPPVLIGVPANEVVMCIEDVRPPPPVTAFDICDTNVTVIFSQTNFGRCPTIIQRCWTAIDDCSNSVRQCQYIYVQPNPPVVFGLTDQTVCEGSNATFCVLASSACPVTYQWFFNGAPILNATNNCHTVTMATPANEGEYCVQVRGPCHTNTVCARLRLEPGVRVMPYTICPNPGEDLTLCPVIVGTGPILSCVWYKQLPDMTVVPAPYAVVDCCLKVPNVSTNDAGNYIVVITSSCNTASNLAVTICPPISALSFPISVVPMQPPGPPLIVTPPAPDGACQRAPICEPLTQVQLCVPDYRVVAGACGLIYQWYKDGVPLGGPNANEPCFPVTINSAADYGVYGVSIIGGAANCVSSNCVELVPSQPQICIDKEADRFTVTPGSSVTYTYSVTNCGCLPLTDVKVIDDNFTPNNAADDIIIAMGLTLQPGEFRIFTRTVAIPQVDCGTNSILRTEVLPNGDVKVTFIENRNNNTYGANTIGWTRDHSFGNLTGSDNAEFQLKNGAGQVVLQFKQDYLTRITPTAQFPAGYRSLGATGGDGGISVGNASDIVSWTTSLEQNLNKEPFLSNLAQYTVDSPATSDPNFPLWEVRMIYMNTIKGSVFGPSGFGQVSIASAHNSPATSPLNIPCEDLCLTNKATVMGMSGTTSIMAMDSEVVCTSSECIDVIKEIACLLPQDNCSPFGKTATGIKGDQDPGFCYQITVINCGETGLTNMTVIDDKLGDLTSLFFPGVAYLPPGGSVTKHVKMAWGVNTTNTVIATGRGDRPGGRVVTDRDSAVALVEPANLSCQVVATAPCDEDGNPNDNHVQLPTNNAPCAVTFTARVCNNGSVGLVDVVVSAPGCGTSQPFSLAPGACADVVLCTRTLRCADVPVSLDVSVTARVDTNSHCAYDITSNNRIRVSTSCRASVDCGQPPDFRLFKNADKSVVDPGGTVTYTYTVTNTGGVTLTGIVVTDDNGTPGVPGDDFVVGTIPSLPPGGSAHLSRTVTLPIRLCDETTGLESGLLIVQVLPNGNIQATFIQDFGVNDNTYGVNSIGWGNKQHKFSNLTGSDQAEFEFRDGSGQVALQFKLDYISASASYPSGFGTLGATGGDGGVSVGSAASIVSFNTSLTENLNKQPFLGNLAKYTVDSPALNDPNSAQWEYRMIYSVVVDQNAFGASGFGSVMIIDQHNSPAKRDVQGPEPCSGCVTNVANAVTTAGGQTLTRMASAIVCVGPPPPSGECPKKSDFWKKNTSQWPAGYSPNQTVVSVFAKASLYPDAAGKTLVQALDGKAGSGSVKDLLKQAVTAVLNAATPGITYPMTVDEVVLGVNMALMNGGEQAIKSLTDLFKKANENKDCTTTRQGNCDTDGRPNVLTLSYNGQSCAAAHNAQMAIQGKTSCSGDPQGAQMVRIVATDSSTPPTASSTRYFDGTVALNQQFEVKSAAAGKSTFGANTYFFIYNGSTLVQTIQIHTSCSAPLVRGDTFGSLLLVDYRIDP